LHRTVLGIVNNAADRAEDRGMENGRQQKQATEAEEWDADVTHKPSEG
jgi:hypothetical protein